MGNALRYKLFIGLEEGEFLENKSDIETEMSSVNGTV